MNTVAKPNIPVALPDVQTYLDYRDFLRDIYQRRKSEFSHYSWLKFAQDLGFSPTNVIRLVCAGKRKLASKSAITIAGALGLKFEQRRYFLNLVTYTDSPGFRRKKESFDLMLAAKREAMTHVTREQMGYFSKWYHPVVRECLILHNGVLSPKDLAGKLFPRVTSDQVQESLNLLENLGLISSLATGGFAVDPGHRVVLPEDEVAGDLTILEYHKQMAAVGARALDEVPQEKREFNALTLRLSQEHFATLKANLVDLCQRAMALETEGQTPTMIAQLNLQFFSLTRSK